MNVFTRKKNVFFLKGFLTAAAFTVGGISAKAQTMQADSTALVNLYNNTSYGQGYSNNTTEATWTKACENWLQQKVS